jgi:DNA modification methylase
MQEISHISDLIPDDINANRGTEAGRSLVEQSLAQYGGGRSILLDKNCKIIAGNKTVEAAGKIGMDNVIIVQTDGTQIVAVQRMDLDMDADPKARELAIADNRSSELGLEWDPYALQKLADFGVNFETFWNEDDFKQLLKSNGVPAESGLIDGADPDEFPDDIECRCSLGDIWKLGRHRMRCGDSTDAIGVHELMDGELADIMWTDPPYGVSYIGKTADALTIENDGADGLPQLLDGSFAAANAILLPGAPIYVAHPAGSLSIVFATEFVKRWRLHETLVWIKDSMVLGHSDYHYKHESILFGYKPGGGRRGRGGSGWFGDNCQVSVFEVPRPKRSEEHPTMKPVELISLMLVNSCPPAGLIYEPFGGSGTTIIAAEIHGSRCYANELDPHYCDVIITRWESVTGKTAVRLG